MTVFNADHQSGPWQLILAANRPTLSFRSVSVTLSYFLNLAHVIVIDWQDWLTQDDVDEIAAAGLNTVRIPLGFWIVDDIVDKTHEPYAEGGLDELVVLYAFVNNIFNGRYAQIRGLSMFKNAG